MQFSHNWIIYLSTTTIASCIYTITDTIIDKKNPEVYGITILVIEIPCMMAYAGCFMWSEQKLMKKKYTFKASIRDTLQHVCTNADSATPFLWVEEAWMSQQWLNVICG